MPTAYLTNTEELTMIADAIREKGELSDHFIYPNGFIDAIRTLTTGTEIIATDMLNNLISGTCYFPTATYIGSYAFASCTKLTGVYLPQVSIVYNSGFYYCSSVSFISLPVCSIVSSCAFYYCSKLNSVYLPECTMIGSSAFFYCSQLSSIDIPKCSYVGSYAFYGCSNLSYISLPSCNYIGTYAFAFCSKMLWADIQGLSVSSFYWGAFYYMSKIQSIYLSGTTTSYIAAGAFLECPSLQSIYLNFPRVLSVYGSIVQKVVPHPTIPNSTQWVGRFDVDVYVPWSLLNSYMASSYWASYNLLPIY